MPPFAVAAEPEDPDADADAEEEAGEEEGAATDAAADAVQQTSEVNQEEDAEADSAEEAESESVDTGPVKVFDWQAAFAALQRKKRKEAERLGIPYIPPPPPIPPEASLSEISDTGQVKITFSKDMVIIENIAEKLGKAVKQDNSTDVKTEQSNQEQGKRLMNDVSDKEQIFKPEVLIG